MTKKQDPDPLQNVMDSEHTGQHFFSVSVKNTASRKMKGLYLETTSGPDTNLQ